QRRAASVDLMASRTLDGEQLLAASRVTAHRSARAGRGDARQAAHVGHELPKLFRTKRRERRHLRSRDTLLYGLEDVEVFVAVLESTAVEWRRPLATRAGGTVTRDAA